MPEQKQDSKQDQPKVEQKQDQPSQPGNTTVAGGRYIVNGKTVDANGKPVGK